MLDRTWTIIAVAALTCAFAAVSLAVATGLFPRHMLRTKLRLGALLLGVGAVSVGCFNGDVSCYTGGNETLEGDTDTDTDSDTDTDADSDTDTDTDADTDL